MIDRLPGRKSPLALVSDEAILLIENAFIDVVIQFVVVEVVAHRSSPSSLYAGIARPVYGCLGQGWWLGLVAEGLGAAVGHRLHHLAQGQRLFHADQGR